MRIGKIVLKNFRNYSDLSWNPHPRFNIITGDNAQGKTNLLEAVFFCTAGRSFRTARDREMINWQTEECFTSALVEKEESSYEISVFLNKIGKETFYINGSKQSKGKIFRPSLALSFTPTDLELVRGSPSERRKWIDLELGPYDFQYIYNLNKYERVLYQRNNLLKGNTEKIGQIIEPWNEQLIFYGSKIINSRINLLKKIYVHLKNVFESLTSGATGKEEISFNYICSIPLEKGMEPEDLPVLYEETIRKKFKEELLRKQTLFGPHRDDLVFFINRSDARTFGSRGQQRSVVLSLKLSLIRMFVEEYGEYPILLLDDVFLELDSHRRKGVDRLLEGEGQVFITSNSDLGENFSGISRTYRIEEGQLY